MVTNWLFLLMGAVQGGIAWWLHTAEYSEIWPATDPVSASAIFYVSLALPLAWYLTASIPSLRRKRRTFIVAGYGVLFALLGAYSAWVAPHSRFDPGLFAAGILGFVLLPLCVHVERHPWRLPYPALFETAWRNMLMSFSALVLTSIFWLVLFAGASLMESIGLRFIKNIIDQPVFYYPVTGLVFGMMFALSLARAHFIVTVRRFLLSILAWLLPLMLLFSVMWVAALPFTGLEPLFQTGSAAQILLWFIALSIFLPMRLTKRVATITPTATVSADCWNMPGPAWWC